MVLGLYDNHMILTCGTFACVEEMFGLTKKKIELSTATNCDAQLTSYAPVTHVTQSGRRVQLPI